MNILKKNKENVIIISIFFIYIIMIPFIIDFIFSNYFQNIKALQIVVNIILFIILNTLYFFKRKDLKNGFISFTLYLLYTLFLPEIINIFFHINELISRIITNIVIFTLLIIVNDNLFKNKFKMFIINFYSYIKYGFKCWITGFLLMININIFVNFLFYKNISINEAANRTVINNNILLSFFLVVIIAPIIEEIVFRGSFKNAFKKESTYSIYTGITFGLMHVLFNGDYLYAISYSILGFFLGKMYYKTDNIYVPIIMHSFHNLLAFLLIIGG